MIALLVIIYVAFISLGLPDSLLGSAWPAMHGSIGADVASAGIISMVIAGGTIVSSLLSDRMIRRLGTGKVTLLSVAMTAAALLGISFSESFGTVCLWAIPLGLGAGSVDAALNNFVAMHYKASHMNWLHSFWGIGASVGPVIMSFLLVYTGTWTAGYRAISYIQFALVAVLILSLPMWKKADHRDHINAEGLGRQKPITIPQLICLPKAKPTLVAFFCYSSLEATVSLWGSSYLVLVRGIGENVAAGWISLFFIGITAGRLLSGFLSMKFAQKHLIRFGQALIAFGIVILLLPTQGSAAIAGLLLIGLGCAPIFPGLLHETPKTFGEKYSQAIMGMQMACAYAGATFMPPVFGTVGTAGGYSLFPVFLIILLAVMVGMVGIIYRKDEKATA